MSGVAVQRQLPLPTAFTASGSYTVTVTSANGCTASSNITITQNTHSTGNGHHEQYRNHHFNVQHDIYKCDGHVLLEPRPIPGVAVQRQLSLPTALSMLAHIRLPVTAANGCTASSSITITQDITPPATGITNNTGTTILTCSTTSIECDGHSCWEPRPTPGSGRFNANHCRQQLYRIG